MVTKKPKGLGRGLEALLGPKADASGEASAAPDTGTPTLIFANGNRVPGAVSAAEVEKQLALAK